MKAFLSLKRVVEADADELVDLGDTDHGKYSLFASLLRVDGQPPSIILEELNILKCPCCGDISDLGDVARTICLYDDGCAICWRDSPFRQRSHMIVF